MCQASGRRRRLSRRQEARTLTPACLATPICRYEADQTLPALFDRRKRPSERQVLERSDIILLACNGTRAPSDMQRLMLDLAGPAVAAGQHGQSREWLITLSVALPPARSLQNTSVPRLAARSATPSTGFIGGAIKPL
jgi:hypothetical protein